MVANKSGITSAFINRVTEEMPGPDLGPEAQLDYLLPLYRGIQSEVTTGESKMAWLSGIIIDALQEVERASKNPEYVATTKKTMGMLVYKPSTLGTGKQASSAAMRIRSLIAKFLGVPYAEAKHYVKIQRTVSYRIDWDAISAIDPSLLQEVRKVTGMQKRPSLVVGKVSKRLKLGMERKR